MTFLQRLSRLGRDIERAGRQIDEATQEFRDLVERIFLVLGRTCSFQRLRDEVERVHGALEKRGHQVIGSYLILTQSDPAPSIEVEIQTYCRNGEGYVRNISRGKLRAVTNPPADVAAELRGTGTVKLYWDWPTSPRQ